MLQRRPFSDQSLRGVSFGDLRAGGGGPLGSERSRSASNKAGLPQRPSRAPRRHTRAATGYGPPPRGLLVSSGWPRAWWCSFLPPSGAERRKRQGWMGRTSELIPEECERIPEGARRRGLVLLASETSFRPATCEALFPFHLRCLFSLFNFSLGFRPFL